MVSRAFFPLPSLQFLRPRRPDSTPFRISRRLHPPTRHRQCHIFCSLAHHLLDEIHPPELASFNQSIRNLSDRRSFSDVLQFYIHIFRNGHRPNKLTLPCILKAVTNLQAIPYGCAVHAHTILLGFHSAIFIQNGVIVMYSRFGEISTARQVFDLMPHRNLVSWTSLISGYAQNGFPLDALHIFKTMRLTSPVVPDFIALVSVLKGYIDVGDLEQGRCVHGLVVKFGLEEELDLLITLTSMYAKGGEVDTARSLFDQVFSPELILWNSMISGYAKNGHAEEAVVLFKKMIFRKVDPDSITLRSAILAFSQLGSLEAARWMWEFVTVSELKNDIFVKTAIIDMYAKCGSVVLARKVFDSIPHRDVVVWSAMIMGYGLYGRGKEAIDLFHEMIQSQIRPNDVTFVGILSACMHAGLVEEGRRYFNSMRKHGVEPRHQHYACIVDLLSRAGHLEEAYEFIREMPMAPEVTVWGALLSACRIHGDVELGKYAADRVFALEPWNAGHYVQLSNIYASAGLWEEVASVRVLMKGKKVIKSMGLSSIEIDGKIQSFYAGDKSHPRSKEIFEMMEELERKLKNVGFLPHTDSILHDLGSEEEVLLCNHSERIAIAHNLRTCVNCHSATKLISKVVDREITVRDANRVINWL